MRPYLMMWWSLGETLYKLTALSDASPSNMWLPQCTPQPRSCRHRLWCQIIRWEQTATRSSTRGSCLQYVQLPWLALHVFQPIYLGCFISTFVRRPATPHGCLPSHTNVCCCWPLGPPHGVRQLAWPRPIQKGTRMAPGACLLYVAL